MAARGEVLRLTDFSGGLNLDDPEYLIDLNASPELQNIDLLSKGFKKRFGDVVFNSTAMDSGAAVTGLGYVKFTSGTEFLNAVAGTKFFKSASLSGTMTDASGAVTITTGQDKIWVPVLYNDLQIWFGGNPNAPFKFNGVGNAAALGGTPPSAVTGFVSNNRTFGIQTAANPSRIFWSVLANPEDWTGTGSGNADVAMNDGDKLRVGIPLSADRAILFKDTSTHLMILTKAPFPIYQLQKGIGVAGSYAAVNVRGMIYFISPSKRMYATSDGVNFIDFPTNINSLWDTVNSSRIEYIQGIYVPSLEQIHWYVSTGTSTTNNVCLVWDLQRKCWLYHPTGFAVNVPALVQNRRLFGGHYNGKIYEKEKDGTYSDASVTSGIIDARWRTPFNGYNLMSGTIHPLWVDFAVSSSPGSTMSTCYGFDFNANQTCETFALQITAAQWDVAMWDVDLWAGSGTVIQRMLVSGRGNVFSVKFSNAVSGQGFVFQGATVQVRTDRARKLQEVS